MTDAPPDVDVVVLGGGGHVGPPLSVVFAQAGVTTRRSCGRSARTDPLVKENRLTMLEWFLGGSDILVLEAPPQAYRNLDIGGKDMVVVWGALGQGIRL